MINKIFEILAGIKKTSHITETANTEAATKIVNEITAGNINPVEAFVMLHYLKSVTDQALTDIKTQTLEHINQEGENTAFNVQLTLQVNKEYAFQQDKEWADINKKLSIYKDALAVREKFLKELVNNSIEAGKDTTPINYTKTITITPKPLSNT